MHVAVQEGAWRGGREDALLQLEALEDPAAREQAREEGVEVLGELLERDLPCLHVALAQAE